MGPGPLPPLRGRACPGPPRPNRSRAGLDAARALFLYEDPVDRLITGLKFHGELAGARVLGTLLARHILAQDVRLPHWLVPMPLHAARYRERGFNQAAAIAAHVASRTGVALDDSLLLRVRATAPQTTLTAAQNDAATARELSRCIRDAMRPPAWHCSTMS